MDNEIIEIPFGISANGVYRSVRYLLGIDIYADDNGWIGESKKIPKKYTYRAIKQYLEDHVSQTYIKRNNHFYVYDSEFLWEHFFLKDPDLARRIKHTGFTSLAQLQFYANKAANRE